MTMICIGGADVAVLLCFLEVVIKKNVCIAVLVVVIM